MRRKRISLRKRKKRLRNWKYENAEDGDGGDGGDDGENYSVGTFVFLNEVPEKMTGKNLRKTQVRIAK